MSATETGWSVRSLLNPVVARLLIFGLNPFDLERTLKQIENTPLHNARQLESLWFEAWENLATTWHRRYREAELRGYRATALQLGLQTAACRLAQFLTNTTDLSTKRTAYAAYANAYRQAVGWYASPIVATEIPLGGEDARLSAHLHLPAGEGPHPCVVVFAGLGSCKEEMHSLARLMVDRGLAALVPDMPGCGETVMRSGLACNSANLSASFRALTEFVAQHGELNLGRLGAVGLCMGGGYAYRACFEQSQYRCCAAMFPLFVDASVGQFVPRWMKTGEWHKLQTGGKNDADLYDEIGWRESYTVKCPLLLIHSHSDNWVALERVRRLYDNANTTDRSLVLVDEKPAYDSGQSATHTMPVGEQLGWVGPMVSDWLSEHLAP